MVPRGEFGLVVVTLGRALHAVPDEIFSAIVVISVLTTVIVPPILTRLYAGRLLAPVPTAGPGDMLQQGHLPNLGATRRLPDD
jgi:hypothetical protein